MLGPAAAACDRHRRRSLPPRIPSRQCAGGTRLAAVEGDHSTHREGSELGEEHAGASTTASARPRAPEVDRRRPPGRVPRCRSWTMRALPGPVRLPVLPERGRRRPVGAGPSSRTTPTDASRSATPRQQSARQQELVCLRSAHADCPRYLRGAVVATEQPASRRIAAVPRATLAALLILVLSAAISFGFVLQRGGIELPVVAGESHADGRGGDRDRGARADGRPRQPRPRPRQRPLRRPPRRDRAPTPAPGAPAPTVSPTPTRRPRRPLPRPRATGTSC